MALQLQSPQVDTGQCIHLGYAVLQHPTNLISLRLKSSNGTFKNPKAKEEQDAKAPPKNKASTPAPPTAALPLYPFRQLSDMHKYNSVDRLQNPM